MAAMTILDPAGESSIEHVPSAPRLNDLRGKRIWFCDNQGDRTGRTEPELNPLFRVWRRKLQDEHGIEAFGVCTDQFTSPYRHGRARFDEVVRTADAIVNGLACCGSGTSALVHDAVEYERAGIPTISVVTDSAEPFARAAMRKLGLGSLRYVVVSHNIHMFALVSTLEEAEAEAERLYPHIVDGLIGR